MNFFFFFLLIIVSCSEKKSNYFPLDRIKSWTYAVEIIPEVENKIFYKKTNSSIGKKKIKVQNKEKILFPVLREDGSILYYEITDQGIFRKGIRYLKNKDMIIDEERLVLPSSIKLDQSWSNDSKTFLILDAILTMIIKLQPIFK